MVSPPIIALLATAGLLGGISGSVAGLASLVSYPVLLAVGLAPVTANVTNTVALVASSAGSVTGSRPELAGRAGEVRALAVLALAGGVIGAALLLFTPAAAFQRVVPLLVGLASMAILLPRRPEITRPRRRRETAPRYIGVFFISIYGGYFGAGAGVLMLALMLVTTGQSLARSNALKNVVLGLANGVAAVGFIVLGRVDWAAAIPLAVGFLLGGRLGPIIVRRAPATLSRLVIAAAGLGLAGYLGLQAYG